MSALDRIVLPLASQRASLELVGGKGHSIAKLAASGLPVPDGFLLATNAYQAFVDANQLQRPILESLDALQIGDANSAEAVSARIQALLKAALLPPEIGRSIQQAYTTLSDEPASVAVRSSATAEDRPDMSFAGQQETYLNICGEAAVIDSIRKCWASLWTARAISYRSQMCVEQQALAMGVVVQRMVQADVSGVLFTANPVSGERSELVINASFGLGEAIVGGHVTPDFYLLDRATFQIKQTILGTKEIATSAAGELGTKTEIVPEAKRSESSLTAETLCKLGDLAVKIEGLFGSVPQDIEWAVADNRCWLLQSRPITNLPPAPLRNVRWDPPAEGQKLIRRQVVENMPEPLSPLFSELYLREGLEHSMDRMVADFKMPIEMEDFVERPIFVTVNGFAYCRANYHMTWRLWWRLPRLLFWYLISLRKLFRTIVPAWRDEGLPEYQAMIERWEDVDHETASDKKILMGVRDLTVADAVYWFRVSMVLGAAKITDDMLHWFLTSRGVKGDLTSGMFLRGFPSKTMEAQAKLEEIARQIQANESLGKAVSTAQAKNLLEVLRKDEDGRDLLEDFQLYLKRYGHQIYNLDFAEPTQIEDPLPLLLSLKALVVSGHYDSLARQRQMAEERELLEQNTLKSLGPLRRSLFRKLLTLAQRFGPNREQALFYIGAAWPTVRRLALELGQRLVRSGTLRNADDLFYLETAEIEKACEARAQHQADSQMGLLASERRELREARKRLHPPGMIPKDSKFKLGPLDLSAFETQKRNPTDSDTLHGFAVSPGKVTGRATLILSPNDFENMRSDTILVCPTTTPAWTPLFTQASGLVTDIGGILAHGSIVAREFGIPAVMGTGNVTQRIVNGQRITVDGDKGIVTILDTADEESGA